jgi:2-oxoglutarate-dependent dioxygenase
LFTPAGVTEAVAVSSIMAHHVRLFNNPHWRPAMTMRASQEIANWTLDPNEIRSYQRVGYLMLPGLLDPSFAETLREEVVRIVSVAGGLTPDDLAGRGEKKHALIQTGQYLKGSPVDRLVNAPEILSIAAQLMGGPSTLYLPFSAIKSGGGGGRFSFHQDNQYTRLTDGLLGINIWIALSAMSPENGCLQMCPGSHLRGTLESEVVDGKHRKTKIDPTDFLPLRMQPGDAVAFSRLTVHGSGVNLTNDPRVAYALQFHRDDALAVWDNREPRPLKNASRWQTGPVDRITPPDPKGRDGH